ncbi:MAG: hypothetical protein ACOX4Q_04675 [Syntrophomonadales bacterium]|jgi:hypothetical protein
MLTTDGVIKIAKTGNIGIFKEISVRNETGDIVVEPGAILQVRLGGNIGIVLWAREDI